MITYQNRTMETTIEQLQPSRLWHYFLEICTIPRPSKKEERIAAYLVDFGRNLDLETVRDEVGNVLIRKPASKGMEHVKPTILQCHIDMVCEKNNDTVHDFENDPIIPRIDKGWIKAAGTTLGADDGIGIAAALAVLESDELEHGPLEALFTVDEETGLTGAFGIKPGFLKGQVLLNLDSEDEGQLFIGCAGGRDTVACFKLELEPVPSGYVAFKVAVGGLRGGHSGDDINKGLGNAVKLLNRFLWNGSKEFGLRISSLDAGNLRNALAREGFAIISLPKDNGQGFLEYAGEYQAIIRDELKVTEPGLFFTVEPIHLPEQILGKELQDKLLGALYACPHGVAAMSREIPDFVETSTNLASVKVLEDKLMVTTSQRSSVESAKKDICDQVSSTFLLAGASVQQSSGYPGWKPDPGSAIVKITVEMYRELFKTEPQVLAIHAGLECGLIGAIYPGMDMVSFGPTIKGAHSPDERLDIESTVKFWQLLTGVLRKIPGV
jgi:dipeptidase D